MKARYVVTAGANLLYWVVVTIGIVWMINTAKRMVWCAPKLYILTVKRNATGLLTVMLERPAGLLELPMLPLVPKAPVTLK